MGRSTFGQRIKSECWRRVGRPFSCKLESRPVVLRQTSRTRQTPADMAVLRRVCYDATPRLSKSTVQRAKADVHQFRNEVSRNGPVLESPFHRARKESEILRVRFDARN